MKFKPTIKDLTVICVAGNKQSESIAAMYKTMKEIDAARYVILTNIDISASGMEIINVGGLGSWELYNRFIVKELWRYFDTTHCLIQQHDGYVINGDCWSDEFLEYDLIGARGMSDGRINYNGGLTCRSLKFQTAIAKDDFIEITSPEDEILCKLYRKYIEEKYGFKYCTPEIADRFSYELHEPTQKTFGFHAYHYQPFKETVVIKRSNATGDVIMCEPLLEYFHKKGYRVVLDTTQENYQLFRQHYFPVDWLGNLNPNIKYRLINLDMAYEIKPQQPVLQSYFEMAGIKDYKLRNPKLNLYSGNNERLFKKYAVIHIDTTFMPYRDVHGVEWASVVSYLENKGYNVFQIGKRVEIEIATHFNTIGLEFLMFFLKGADLFIGCDSAPSHIAVGFGVPSVIFFGSVNPKFRHNDFTNIRVVQSTCPIEGKQHCYHEEAGRVIGSDCVVKEQLPPCANYTSDQVINAIKELI